MSDDFRADAGAPPLAGRTVLTGHALQHLALGLVRDAARVPARELSVSLSDEAGRLHAAVILPVALAPDPWPAQSLPARGAALREAVAQGMAEFAGRAVSSVDVRFSGVRPTRARRVR